ncbi:unnamed protein product [Arabis nemorensis]|uniref:SWIM-type domain-containing protein n=1 Tax=Arabis nemorensis TaxID=586526 RepID=A0A565BYR2_9BRAS|nr:unnamed protein product [Arabis nemorensis]
MLTRWFHKRRNLSSNHKHPLTIAVEKKIDRRIEKGKTFMVYQINDYRFIVKGDSYDCIVDLQARTCSCGKYGLIKILCRHAIKAGLSVGREPHSLTDHKYTTVAWRAVYEECINLVSVPEDAWRVPPVVELVQVLPPETRRAAGRRKKRRYESAEDKIQSSKGSKGSKKHKCSRCHITGHNRATCDMAI